MRHTKWHSRSPSNPPSFRPIAAAAILALTLAGCQTTAAGNEPLQILSATPAGIEISAWCSSADDPQCRQRVADQAQTHCRRNGQNAQYTRSQLFERSLVSGERVWFNYSCVRQ
jgi:hypothetical protein